MCDNKPLCTLKKLPLPKSQIDNFYDNRKQLFDICGNFINKDKYPFINILSTYLVDIVNSIDIEINKSTRNSMINWREKKNPKLLSKFINNDDNINIINRSMNKITSSNYMTIAAEISNTLMQDNFRKLPEYCKFLFDIIIKKSLNDESFAIDYLHFLTAFDGVIGININKYIYKFINEVFNLLKNKKFNTNTNNTDNTDNTDNTNIDNIDNISYFSYIKDSLQYFNIGIIFANLYIIKNDNNLTSNITYLSNFTEESIYENFILSLNQIYNYLVLLPPSNVEDLYSIIYLSFGILEILGDKLLNIMSENNINFLNDILNLIYNINNIPNKIKFKILDLQDIIKTFEKNVKQILKQKKQMDIEINTVLETESYTQVDTQVDTQDYILNNIHNTKLNSNSNLNNITSKPHFSSLKLVQMKSNRTPIELINKLELKNIVKDVVVKDVAVKDVVVKDVVVKDVVVKDVVVKDVAVKDVVVKDVVVKDNIVKENQEIKIYNKNTNGYNTKQNNYRIKHKNSNSNPNPNSNPNSNFNSNPNPNPNPNNISKLDDDDNDGFIKIERKSKHNITINNTSNNNTLNNNTPNNKNNKKNNYKPK